MNVSCARCHDHKFDPIPQTDYYALHGILQSGKLAFPGTEVVPGEKDPVILATGELAEKARSEDAERMAFGMQREMREVLDLSKESDATHALYGLERGSTRGFGWQCLVARRLAPGTRAQRGWRTSVSSS